MTTLLRTVFLLLLASPKLCSASCASVVVKGHLMCNGQPYANEKVQLWEPKILGPELWNDRPTGADGKFHIFSHGYDVTLFDIKGIGFGIHPYLWIPNYCGSDLKDGKRCTKNIIQILIPEGYVQPCQPDVYTFDLGTIHMDTERPSEFNWLQRLFGQHYECRNY